MKSSFSRVLRVDGRKWVCRSDGGVLLFTTAIGEGFRFTLREAAGLWFVGGSGLEWQLIDAAVRAGLDLTEVLDG